MKTQISLEDIIHNLAVSTEEPAVILTDRGLMDSAGYVGFEMFHKICSKMNWDITELRDNRYDAVIHLVTAADGAREFYDYKNEARFETPEEAIERDHKLKTAYVGHNRVTVIGNEGDFQSKMDKTLAFVNSLLGLPTERTRYKKFLLKRIGS